MRWAASARIRSQTIGCTKQADMLLRARGRRAFACFIAGEGHRISSQLADRVVRGALFRLFFAASPRGREPISSDLCRDLEALTVIRTLFIQQVIGWRYAMLA